MRIVFFGTPSFAVPALDAVSREHEVALVVAQPDKPAGRGMKLHAPEVIVRARELGLPTAQPPRVRNEEFLQQVRELKPDAGIVVAYGKILPGALLEIPKHGFFNVHGSVLPQYRGAAPIQRAIAAGDRVTGITIMRVDEELDHGPMLAVRTTGIGEDEHTPSLAQRLSSIGGEALVEVLRDLERGTAVETPQDHIRATIAPKIDKSEGLVRFDESAASIYNRFRAFDPWPGLFLESDGETIKLTDMRPVDATAAPRTIVEVGEGVVIACAQSALRVMEMQRAGKPRTPAAAVARGLGWRVGERVP